MKKNIRNAKSPTRGTTTKLRKSDRVTIGVDLGDRTSRYCALNGAGEVLAEGTLSTTKKGVAGLFAARKRKRI